MLTLVCPQCQASYQLPETHFGPMGKKVRCANCGHIWVAHDDLSTTSSLDNLLAGLSAVPNSPEAEPVEQPTAKHETTATNSFSDALAAAEAAPAAILVAERTTSELGKPKIISSKRLDQARQQTAQNETDYGLLKIARWSSLATAAAIILVFTAGNAWVVQKWPQLLPVYQQIGFHPLPAASGLQFVNINDDSAPAAADQPLRIHGEIENLTDQPKQVPMLVLHVTSPTGQTKQFVHNLHDQVIKPHESLVFSIERPHFAEAGWKVDLRFD